MLYKSAVCPPNVSTDAPTDEGKHARCHLQHSIYLCYHFQEAMDLHPHTPPYINALRVIVTVCLCNTETLFNPTHPCRPNCLTQLVSIVCAGPYSLQILPILNCINLLHFGCLFRIHTTVYVPFKCFTLTLNDGYILYHYLSHMAV